MTVCVAAIGNNGASVFGASDQMITAGDIQFEPSQQKIWKLSPHIAMMVSGDVGVHSMFWTELYHAIMRTIRRDPAHRWTVRAAAQLYLDSMLNMQAKNAERDLLRPIGLSLHDFIARQKEMQPEFARQLADRLQRYPCPEVSAIVVGQDDDGVHIFVVEDGELTCSDPIGFAAIGAGFWHANSYLMFAGHTRFETGPRTLFRLYAAKKRAEVAPGVGSRTDMFVIGGATPGEMSNMPPPILQGLREMYGRYLVKLNEANALVNQEADMFGEAIRKAQEAELARQAPSAQAQATAPVAPEKEENRQLSLEEAKQETPPKQDSKRKKG